MNDIIEKLKQYEFFQNKKILIYNIQDYGRKSKFKIEIDKKYYTLILSKKRIQPYINKMRILNDNFKKIIGFQYLSDDEEILVLDYFGNNKGIDLVKLENQNYNMDEENFCLELKKTIDDIHSNKAEYIDFSDKNYQSWKEYYLDEIREKIESIYKQHLIDENTQKILLDKLEDSSKIYTDNYQMTFIHADITPLNVCINIESKHLYLIDYDDFKIGDPLMDISRIINCKNMSKIFSKLVEKYYHKYENNSNHLFYTLRVNINWYHHIIEKKQENIYDLDQAKEDIYDIIDRIIRDY